MNKHTPGPWQFYTPCEYPNDFRIATVGENDTPYVCRITKSHGSGPGSTNPSKADARLIAASPDLLAACEAALSELGSFCHAYVVDPDIQPAMVQLRAAIAKAKGGAD